MTKNMKALTVSVAVLAVITAVYFALPDGSPAIPLSRPAAPIAEGASEVLVDGHLMASTGASPSQPATANEPMPNEGSSPPKYLPTENMVLGIGGVNVDALDRQLEDPRFKEFVSRFEKESASDALATQLTDSTRNQIEQQLHGGPQHLDRFACGLTLCVGSIRAATGAATDWWQELGDGGDVRAYVFYDANVALSASEEEQRFVFSIDPRVRSFFGTAKPGSH